MKRIQLISGPRNLSTALMYSFDNRGDCTIIDEPFYAHYLTKSGVDHPGKEEIIASMPSDIQIVIEQQLFGNYDTDLVFFKNMAQHFRELDFRFITKLSNVFLIRDPRALIASFSKVIHNPDMKDIGLKIEWELFDYLHSLQKEPVVVDSGELVKDPEKVIRALCSSLSISYSDKMLKWAPGSRKEDGVWAKYWYRNVHLSTHFSKQRSKERKMPKRLIPLYEEAREYYNKLFIHAIKA